VLRIVILLSYGVGYRFTSISFKLLSSRLLDSVQCSQQSMLGCLRSIVNRYTSSSLLPRTRATTT
jgi:hypothetical protein